MFEDILEEIGEILLPYGAGFSLGVAVGLKMADAVESGELEDLEDVLPFPLPKPKVCPHTNVHFDVKKGQVWVRCDKCGDEHPAK